MKGISPLLATIILIALTVGAGAIISVWLSTLTTSTTGYAGGGVTNSTQCGTVYIDVPSVTSNGITYGNPSTQSITSIVFVYSASGSIPIIVTPGTGVYSGSATITAGQYSTSNATRGTNTTVTVKGLCLASVPVAGTCSAGQSCWQ